MSQNKIDLITQALSAAESSIAVARKLLTDLDTSAPKTKQGGYSKQSSPRENRADYRRVPGIFGVFDGEFMVAQDRKKYRVPENYVSKSMIVQGDKLKMVTEDGKRRFKQVERVKRKRLIGILAKKDGRYVVITESGSFRVLKNSVDHFGFKLEDEVEILVPVKGRAIWGAIEKKVIKTQEKKTGEQKKKASIEPKKPEVKNPEVKRPEIKVPEFRKSEVKSTEVKASEVKPLKVKESKVEKTEENQVEKKELVEKKPAEEKVEKEEKIQKVSKKAPKEEKKEKKSEGKRKSASSKKKEVKEKKESKEETKKETEKTVGTKKTKEPDMAPVPVEDEEALR